MRTVVEIVQGKKKGLYTSSKCDKPLMQKYYDIEQRQKQQRQDAESQVESVCLFLHNGVKVNNKLEGFFFSAL